MSDQIEITQEYLTSKKLSKDWDNWVCPITHSTWMFHRKYPKDMIKHVMKCPECFEKMGNRITVQRI
jgi:hypothetical protein